jgi:hypothetical protein
MSNWYTDTIRKSSYFDAPECVRDLSLLEPRFRLAVLEIIDGAMRLDPPIRLIVTETYRSQERQQQLFSEGSTQLRTVGVHHYGLAADFAKVVNGLASWAGDWSFLRDLANANGVISGLDWGHPDWHHNFVDPDHVQGCAVTDQGALFAGTWYPPESGPVT